MNHNNNLMSTTDTSLMVLYRESMKRISITIGSNFSNNSWSLYSYYLLVHQLYKFHQQSLLKYLIWFLLRIINRVLKLVHQFQTELPLGFFSAKFLYIFGCIDSEVIVPPSRDGLPVASTHAPKVSWAKFIKKFSIATWSQRQSRLLIQMGFFSTRIPPVTLEYHEWAIRDSKNQGSPTPL